MSCNEMHRRIVGDAGWAHKFGNKHRGRPVEPRDHAGRWITCGKPGWTDGIKSLPFPFPEIDRPTLQKGSPRHRKTPIALPAERLEAWHPRVTIGASVFADSCVDRPRRVHPGCRIYDCRLDPIAKTIDQSPDFGGESIQKLRPRQAHSTFPSVFSSATSKERMS